MFKRNFTLIILLRVIDISYTRHIGELIQWNFNKEPKNHFQYPKYINFTSFEMV